MPARKLAALGQLKKARRSELFNLKETSAQQLAALVGHLYDEISHTFDGSINVASQAPRQLSGRPVISAGDKPDLSRFNLSVPSKASLPQNGHKSTQRL